MKGVRAHWLFAGFLSVASFQRDSYLVAHAVPQPHPNNAQTTITKEERTLPMSTLQTIVMSQSNEIIEKEMEVSVWKRDRHLTALSWVAAANIFLNTVRPDPSITWQMRLPRIWWEMCIWIVSRSASNSPRTFLLLLSIMTGSTALLDIFVWGPFFATFASFAQCSGGWFGKPRSCVSDYTNGIGRLVVGLEWNGHSTFYDTDVHSQCFFSFFFNTRLQHNPYLVDYFIS